MDIWITLKKAVDFYPEKTAVVDGQRAFTYTQIRDRVAALARFFQAQAIGQEDRISILEVNSHAFLEVYYAAAGIGAILNPINYRLAPKEIAFRRDIAGISKLPWFGEFAASVVSKNGLSRFYGSAVIAL